MTIQEAIKSGKPFRLKSWRLGYYIVSVVNESITNKDLLSNDWETKPEEPKREIRVRLVDDRQKCWSLEKDCPGLKPEHGCDGKNCSVFIEQLPGHKMLSREQIIAGLKAVNPMISESTQVAILKQLGFDEALP